MRRLIKKVLAMCLVTAIFASAFGVSAATNSVSNTNNASSSTPIKRNVMYYGDWSIWGGEGQFYPAQMPANLYTHLNYAFLDFNADGSLKFCDPDAPGNASLGQPGVTWGDINAGLLPAFRALRAENPNMKIGISVGGWSKSGDFTAVTKNDATRAKFVSNLVKFVEYTGMDFIDIDWEYPGDVRPPDTCDNEQDEGTTQSIPEDKENYIKLLSELRVSLDKLGAELGKDFELSCALPISRDKLSKGVDIKRMFEIIDFGNMMTYDARGAWDKVTGHQTPLYGNPADPHYEAGLSVDQTIQYMIANGAPAEKLVVGAAFYSRGWAQADAEGPIEDMPGLFTEAHVVNKDANLDPTPGALNEKPLKNGDGGRAGGVWSYRNLDTLKSQYPGIVEYWDDVAKAPYLYDSKTGAFFTFDNARSIAEKTKYVNDNNLGGMITWMASNDKITNDGNKRDELTKAIAKGLYGDSALPAQEIIESPLDITTTVKTYSESWSGSGYDITIKNNEKLSESDSVVRIVETQCKSIMLPKLYVDNSGIALISGGYEGGTATQDGDLTVVNLAASYSNKVLKPGESISFKLRQNSGEVSLDNLKSIELVQFVNSASPEMKRQVIYGSTEAVNAKPAIIGAMDKSILVGGTFDSMSGITAYDKEDGDLTSAIKVTGSVDTSKEGKYPLTYTVTDKDGEKVSVTITISVVKPAANTPPVISGASDKTILVGNAFDSMNGITASDKEDGDLTSAIKVTGSVDTSKEGKYPLTYTVTDKDGVKASVTITISVVKQAEDNTQPVINGVSNKTISVGDTFDSMNGITASDKEDGDLTSAIKVTGSVDTSKAGSYTLTYTVTDKDGLAVTATAVITVVKKDTPPVGDSDFGVGKGIEWEDHVFAPFVDLVAWVPAGNPYASDLTEGGCLDLNKVSKDTGVKYYNLGFINAASNGTIVDGVLDWGWGGYKVLSEKYSNGDKQYADMKRVIKDVRASGGDVTISIGGALENNFFQKTSDVGVLEKTYLEIINGYGLTRIDLDIEGGAQGYALNTPNAKALKRVQDQTGVKIILTLPVLPNGLTQNGLDTLKAYLDNDVDVEIVNIMTMCYGTSTLLPGEDYGTASTRAVDSLMNQLKVAYKAKGVTLTSAEAYAKIGTTVSIGYESGAHPVFTTAMSQVVVDHAKSKGVGMVSFWSMNRDTKTQANPNIDKQYEHTDIFKTFSDEIIIVNEAPKLFGVSDKSVFKGEAFDAMKGVTAIDEEDGDLTSKIVVTGKVDAETLGEYKVTYTVVDSEGKTTTKMITVKVVEPVEGDVIPWTLEDQAAGKHVPGILVSYNGSIYKQISSGTSWWCEPGTAGSASVWEKVGDDSGYVEPDALEWNLTDQAAGKYKPGVKVTYNGVLYVQIGSGTCWWGAPDVTPSYWEAI